MTEISASEYVGLTVSIYDCWAIEARKYFSRMVDGKRRRSTYMLIKG